MKEKEKTNQDKFMSGIKTIKIFSWILLVVCCMLGIAITVCSVSYLYEIREKSIEEIQQNEELLNYVGKINNYSYIETKYYKTNIDNKIEFAVIEIVVQSLFLIAGYILLTIGLKNILHMLKNVSDKKTLLTEEKTQILKKIVIQIGTGALLIINNMFIWISIEVLLGIVYDLFKLCVENPKNKKIIEK